MLRIGRVVLLLLVCLLMPRTTGAEPSAVERWRAVAEVEWSSDQASVDKMVAALKDPDAKVRQTAARALGYAGDKRAVESLIGLLGDANPLVAVSAAQSLGRLKDPRAILPLVRMEGKRGESLGNVYIRQALNSVLDACGFDGLNTLLKGADKNVLRCTLAAIARTKDPRAADTIARFMNDADLRETAIYTLARLHDPRAVEPLKAMIGPRNYTAVEALADYKTPEVAACLISRLSGHHEDGDPVVYPFQVVRMGEVALEPLVKALKDPKHPCRDCVLDALTNLKSPKAIPALLDFRRKATGGWVDDPVCGALNEMGEAAADALIPILSNPKDRWMVIDHYTLYRDMRAVEPLIAALKSDNEGVRQRAAQALGIQGDKRAIEPLKEALADREVRGFAAQSLGMLGATEAIPRITLLLKAKETHVRAKAAQALGAIGDKRSVEPLLGLLDDKHISVKCAAIQALVGIGDRRAVAPITNLVHFRGEAQEDDYSDIYTEMSDSDVRNTAIICLGRFGGDAMGTVRALIDDPDEEICRAAVEALLEVRDRESVPLLARLLDSPDEGRRSAAVRAILRLAGPTEWAMHMELGIEDDAMGVPVARAVVKRDDPAAREPLISALREFDPTAKDRGINSHSVACAALALGWLKDERAVEPLVRLLEGTMNGPLAGLRRYAVEALGDLGDKRAVPVLIAALREWDPWISEHTPPHTPSAAAYALAKIGDPRAVEPLTQTLQYDDPFMGEASAQALGAFGDKRALKPLNDLLADEDPRVRIAVCGSLVRLGDEKARERLLAVLDGKEDSDTRSYAVTVLGALSDPASVSAVEGLLKHPDRVVRHQAMQMPARRGDRRSAELLIGVLESDPEPDIRYYALASLRAITGRWFGVDPAAWRAWLNSDPGGIGTESAH